MKTLPLSEAKANLSKLVDDVNRRDERVMITRHGRPAAVLMSADELESWQETMEIMADPELMADIRRGVRELDAGKGRTYSDKELRKLFAIDEERPRPRGRVAR